MQPLIDGDPRQVGRFEIVGRLGSGGMGRVYLARVPSGEQFALKMIHQFLSDDTQFRRRFEREVMAARRVSGAHTADLVDADPDARPPWMAVEYVDGPTLTELIDRDGPLSLDAAVDLAAGMAQALLDIHAVDLVHRDLKPSNVLMAEAGPCLIDFGIAQANGASSLTMTGLVTGSAGFMSPEQAQAERVTAASDVFALGTVLYFAATGRRPFGEGTSIAVTYRVVHAEADMAAIADEGLRRLIGDCLLKDPKQRPTTQQVLDRCPGVRDGTWRDYDPDPTVVGASPAEKDAVAVPEPAAASAGTEIAETAVGASPAGAPVAAGVPADGSTVAGGAVAAPGAAAALAEGRAEAVSEVVAGTSGTDDALASPDADAESTEADDEARSGDEALTVPGAGAPDATLQQPGVAGAVAASAAGSGSKDATSDSDSADSARTAAGPVKGAAGPTKAGAGSAKAVTSASGSATTVPASAKAVAAAAESTSGAAKASTGAAASGSAPATPAPAASASATPGSAASAVTTSPGSPKRPRRSVLSLLPQPLWATAVAATSVLVAGTALTTALIIANGNRSDDTGTPPAPATGSVESSPTPSRAQRTTAPSAPVPVRTGKRGSGTNGRPTGSPSPTPTPSATATQTLSPTGTTSPPVVSASPTPPPDDPPASSDPVDPPPSSDPPEVDPSHDDDTTG